VKGVLNGLLELSGQADLKVNSALIGANWWEYILIFSDSIREVQMNARSDEIGLRCT
jgi:hypothetical protein